MTYNIDEIKDILRYIIDNNKRLQEENKKAITVSLRGDAGLGKTSAIEQIGEELGYNTVIIRLSNIEDPSDLLGFPITEYEVAHEGDTDFKWAPKDIIVPMLNAGYYTTNNVRMGYAVPKWLPQDDKPILLVLDDFSRANPLILQAAMEIIHEQKYLSWSLPKGSNVILSENPDNGDYQVTSIDDAFRSRFVTFDVDFNIDVWARWAEAEGIRSEAINFLLYAPELISKKENKTINARSMTMFFNAISGLEDWSKTSNLAFILSIADGCFKDEANVVGNMFTTFINNKLDKLVSPKEMIDLSWTALKTKLNSMVYDSNGYRADIASILTVRFINYVNLAFERKEAKSEDVINRILDFINPENEKSYLTEDLFFNLIKTIMTKHPQRTKKLKMNPQIIKRIL
jgi:hypothetical protein